MLNRTVLTGRLTKDPELRYTPNGIAVTTFIIAVNRAFTNQQGEREADFIPIVVWRKQAENAANYLKKGSLAGIDGKIQVRNYEGSDGKRVYVTEVVADNVQFLESKKSQGGQQDDQQSYNQNPANAPNPYQQNRQQSQQQNQRQPQQNQNYQQQNRNQQQSQNNQQQQFTPYDMMNNGPINVSDDDLPF